MLFKKYLHNTMSYMNNACISVLECTLFLDKLNNRPTMYNVYVNVYIYNSLLFNLIKSDHVVSWLLNRVIRGKPT